MRWKNRPDGSNWGDFGPDDELGRLNLLTPAKVLQGIAEVRDGRSFCLSLPLDYPGGNVLNRLRHPPRRFTSGRGDKLNYNFELQRINPTFTDVVSDDAVLLYTQYSTQWDALSHVGGLFDADGDGVPEPLYYNGWRAGTDICGPSGHEDALEGVNAERLGIDKMAATAVSGRAVLIDLHRHCGNNRELIDHARLQQIMQADGVVVEPGDMVCLYTGFADVILGMGGQPDAAVLDNSCAVLDGRDPALLQWITDCGLSVLIADNYAVEAYPARDGGACCAALPLHEHCLFKLGIHLGELWYLSELARALREQGRYRFMLTAPPLRLPGAVGSPVTPVALI
ncbi:MAG: cyclase [Gammaproteobacteria bacterium HGW-Gammaproteobacteria-6]|nr:MAG: cyclase [Gammaproteobacteria bacterium HGW-Gammaproteobacteria-6]